MPTHNATKSYVFSRFKNTVNCMHFHDLCVDMSSFDKCHIDLYKLSRRWRFFRLLFLFSVHFDCIHQTIRSQIEPHLYDFKHRNEEKWVFFSSKTLNGVCMCLMYMSLKNSSHSPDHQFHQWFRNRCCVTMLRHNMKSKSIFHA